VIRKTTTKKKKVATPKKARQAIEKAPKTVRETFEDHAITPDYLAWKLYEELNAEETKFFTYGGEVFDERKVIDWGTRQRARQDACEQLGLVPSKRHELSGKDGGSINIHFHSPIEAEGEVKVHRK
jgi:hypothetical protein